MGRAGGCLFYLGEVRHVHGILKPEAGEPPQTEELVC